MRIHLIHKWSKWKTVRKEVVEQMGGVLVPYTIQEKHCEKCGKVKISVSEIIVKLRLSAPLTD